ncbi:Phosphomevalonate kinase [Choiromyces venosus 120613-1]|uniref:Phosphomevalonate kinase n=1 Tax=Choiromyces venosus 120613-1 TaxID=1336337 RepID=A0A3N4JHY6_9PEZI|nr:Phosphomevalonate kinase [Choiromyces venosus 120613-1]
MSIAVSAPGKVLLAGGYLVLDKNYSGLVFGLSARIHTISTISVSETGTILVRSPQFATATWTYTVSSSENGVTVEQVPDKGSSKNTFVETTIRYVLSYLSLSKIVSSEITILADNDYYSQPTSTTPLRFNNLNVPLSSAHKTGLGSSAALVTSLTSCLLQAYSPAPLQLSGSSYLTKIHNLSQAAHCAAQGKVGSGFDVAAAVFGSCVYRRFSPSILQALPEANAPGFRQQLREAVDKSWDMGIEKTKIPKGVRVIMGDVDCGSSTPGMVKKVLAWREGEKEAARKQWDELERVNRGLIDLLAELSEGSHDAVRQQILDIRKNIRAMGEAADVPIEPEEQTKLLDAVSAGVPGVLGGVVPGAGGYDAVAFIVKDNEETVTALKEFLAKWDDGKVKALETREEQEGVRMEQTVQYEGFGNYLKLT